MKDPVERQAAIDALEKIPVREFKKTDGLLDALVSIGQVYRALKQLPSAQPERKKGKWQVCNILDCAQRPTGRKTLRCPFCGYLSGEFLSMVDYYHKLTRFCPNCGSEMS